jgi:hypothetical protein
MSAAPAAKISQHRRLLDKILTGVHHRDPVDRFGDHSQVVRDQQ